MADKRISGLPGAERTTKDDLLLIVDDPLGTPTNKRITVEGFFSNVNPKVVFSNSVSAFQADNASVSFAGGVGIQKNLIVLGDLEIKGNVKQTQAVTIEAFNSNLVPFSHMTFDIGNNTTSWKNLHVKFIEGDTSGDLTITANTILSADDFTIYSDIITFNDTGSSHINVNPSIAFRNNVEFDSTIERLQIQADNLDIQSKTDFIGANVTFDADVYLQDNVFHTGTLHLVDSKDLTVNANAVFYGNTTIGVKSTEGNPKGTTSSNVNIGAANAYIDANLTHFGTTAHFKSNVEANSILVRINSSNTYLESNTNIVHRPESAISQFKVNSNITLIESANLHVVGTNNYITSNVTIDSLVHSINLTDSTTNSTGSVVLDGGMGINKQLTVGDRILLHGDLHVNNNITANGTMMVDGNVTFNDNLQVFGDIHANGSITSDGGILRLGNNVVKGVASLDMGTLTQVGVGHVAGTYNNVDLLNGTGSGAQATVVVGNDGNISGITITAEGTAYTIGDTLTISSTVLGGSASETVDVSALTQDKITISSVLASNLVPHINNFSNLGNTLNYFANAYMYNLHVRQNTTIQDSLSVTGNLVSLTVRNTYITSNNTIEGTNTDISSNSTFIGANVNITGANAHITSNSTIEGTNTVTTSNATFTGANVSVTGTNVHVTSNSTIQGTNTDISSNSTFTGANVNIVGTNAHITSNSTIEGTNTVTTSNSTFTGANVNITGTNAHITSNSTIEGTNTVTTSNATFTGANVSVTGSNVHISSNSTIEGTDTSITSNSAFTGANLHVTGSNVYVSSNSTLEGTDTTITSNTTITGDDFSILGSNAYLTSNVMIAGASDNTYISSNTTIEGTNTVITSNSSFTGSNINFNVSNVKSTANVTLLGTDLTIGANVSAAANVSLTSTVDSIVDNTAGALTVAGGVGISKSVTIGQNLNVHGNIHANGNITSDGSLVLGDEDTDSVTFGADVSSHIIPDVDSTYDLGTDSKRFRNIFADDITVTQNTNISDSLSVTGSNIHFTTSNNYIEGNTVIKATDTTISSNLSIYGSDILLKNTASILIKDIDSFVLNSSPENGANNVLKTQDGFGIVLETSADAEFYLRGYSTISGNNDVGGFLTVGRKATITGNASIGGTTTSAGILNVTDSTDSSSNTTGSIVASGGVGILKSVTIGENLQVHGNIHANGNITSDGSLVLGDADTDSVTFGADISSHIIPDVDSTYDLGTDSKRFRNFYADDIFVTQNTTITDSISVVGSNAHFATGNTSITGNVSLTGDNLTATGTNFDVTSNVSFNNSNLHFISSNIHITSTDFKVVANSIFDSATHKITGESTIQGGIELSNREIFIDGQGQPQINNHSSIVNFGGKNLIMADIVNSSDGILKLETGDEFLMQDRTRDRLEHTRQGTLISGENFGLGHSINFDVGVGKNVLIMEKGVEPTFPVDGQGNKILPNTQSYLYSIIDKEGSEKVHLYTMDAGGSETRLGAHNDDGEWEYFSRNIHTGKVVRVNMEKMIRKLEEFTGEKFIEEE